MPASVQIEFGLQPSSRDAALGVGHAWLSWDAQLDGHAPYRGYYLDFVHIPLCLWSDPRKLKQALLKDSFKGVVAVDLKARVIVEEGEADVDYRAKMLCQLGAGGQRRLMSRCFVPSNQLTRPSGLYSWSETLAGAHNCSSWAVEVASEACSARLPILRCRRPKRLLTTEVDVWGDVLGSSSQEETCE